MPTSKKTNDLAEWPLEWLRIAPPPEVEHLSSLSWDTIIRRYPDKVKHLGKRRSGMRVGDALMLGGAEST